VCSYACTWADTDLWKGGSKEIGYWFGKVRAKKVVHHAFIANKVLENPYVATLIL